MRKMIYNDEQVIYIEYIDGLPHQVITAPLDSAWGLTWFDFEYIGDDRKDLMWYESGMGGCKTKLQAPHFVNSEGNFYWMADGCKFEGRTKAKNCQRVDKPIRIKGWSSKSSINPFKVADESSYNFEYCKICDAYYTGDEGCSEHHVWNDEHGGFAYHDGTFAD